MNTRTLKLIVPTFALCAALGGALSGQAQPTTTAPTPTQPQARVICVFDSSGVYTNFPNINDFENWGGWNYAADYSIPPNVLAYYGLAYGGIGFEQSPQAVAGCTNLHVDVFTPNGNCLAIRLVDTSGHSADVTYTSAGGVITSGSWIGLDMPLSQFKTATPALNLGAIQQIGLIANNAGETPGSDYYLDNIYFTSPTNIVPPPPIPTPTNNAPTPTRSASGVLAMYDSSGVYTEASVGSWDASWSSAIENPFTIANTGNVVLNYDSLQYAGVTGFNIDAAAYNTLHVDVWTPNANQFGIQLVSLDNGGTQAAQVNILPGGSITTNQWVGLDIPLNQFTAINAGLDLTALQQLLWIDNQGGGITGGIFYIDNIYFYSNSVAPPPIATPTNNAPTPTLPSSGVLAMYDSSGVYPEVPIDDWNASWSGASESTFTITNTGKVVLQYGALSYAGVEFYSPDQINVTSYNTMHVDVWTPDANQFGIQLVSLNPTLAGQVNITPASGLITSNHWVSLDIPLSAFTAATNQIDAGTVDLSNLQQLLWIDNQAGGFVDGIFYIDNVYFYTSATLTRPTVTATKVGGSIQLSFATQATGTYTVQYKAHLTDAWQTLTSVSGNGSIQAVTDTINPGARFYQVTVH